MAQDSLFVVRFQNNLSELLIKTDLNEFDARFKFNPEVNFHEAYNQLQVTVFSDLLDVAEDYYVFFENMPERDKKLLLYFYALYQPVFNQFLQNEGLSPELSYFPVVLTALNSWAVSNDRRAGVWQLSHFQAVLNSLEVGHLTDERFNVKLATMAAAQEIKKSKQFFGSDEWAILAFLAGNAKVRNVKTGISDFVLSQDCLHLFAPEIQIKIAAYQALAVFLNQNKCSIISSAPETDTVWVTKQLHFKQVADVLSCTEKQLYFLNPKYTFGIVPAKMQKQELILPGGLKDDYLIWIDSIYNSYDSSLFQVTVQNIEYPPAPNRQYLGEKVKDLQIEGKTKIKYTLKSGDVLGFIAEDFDVRVADLKYWNNIYNERRIQAGQKIDIFVDDDKADYYRKLAGIQKNVNSSAESSSTMNAARHIVPLNAQKIEHVVRSGESPYLIAQKYTGVSPEQILNWNGIDDARKIQIGQKLIIYIKQ
jgi:membrane-bound lytic murein transglycosylase D